MEQFVAMSETMTGPRLIAACKRGDRDAFRQLFEQHKDRVHSVALYFFGGNGATAADVTQQVFLKLFTKIELFKGDSEFTTWLYRLVVNTCLDEQRKLRRFLSFNEAQGEAPPKFAHEHPYEHDELAECVKAAVAQLRPKLRIVMLLKYFEELSYEEMAEILGCSKGTVASRLNRGHKALAQKLGHVRGQLLQGGER